MIVDIALTACVVIIFYLILLNIRKIKALEKKYDDTIVKTTLKLNSLNSKISNVVSQNNDINVTNIQKLLKKIEDIEEVSVKSDNRMKVELDNLRRKLIFLLENNEVYGLMMKNNEDSKSKESNDKK
tara:strand:- start:1125 stop:1505 length:381 start_codon:yes stop_codon:yes gene_type:complete